jgi:hypothetical protein
VSRTRVPNALIANPAVSIISAPNTSGPMTISTNALCSGTLSVSGFSSLAGISNSGSLTNSGQISFTPDNTYDIGQNATTARPRDLWLGRNLTAGGTVTGGSFSTAGTITATGNITTSGTLSTSTLGVGAQGQVVRKPVNDANGISVEAPNGYAFISSKLGTHVGGNAWWDGANWQRYDTTVPSAVWIASANGATFMTSPAGTGTLPLATKATIDTAGAMTAASFATTGKTAAAGNINVGQVNATYIVTAGIDVGAGPIYFANNASYYINKDATNNLNVVNMNVVSWGNVCFSGNTGIYMGGWDGTWIHTSHSIMMNGANLGFSNNGGVYWSFDGSWIRAYGASGIGTSGSYYWMANNASVGLYWDGTWVNIQPRAWAVNEMSCDVGVIRNQSSGLRFIDDNVRIVRPAGANQLKTYVYDAWEQWHRTWDGASMGYVDINGFHNGSTIKNKHNLRDFSDGLALLKDSRIRPRRYTMTDVPRGKGRRMRQVGEHPGEHPEELIESEHVGFIAEEMVEVIPEVVGLDHETGEPVGINYGALVPILWDAVRRLAERLDKLEGAAA